MPHCYDFPPGVDTPMSDQVSQEGESPVTSFALEGPLLGVNGLVPLHIVRMSEALLTGGAGVRFAGVCPNAWPHTL